MFGSIILLLIVGAVLYLLWVNNKLNANSLNESFGQSSDSVQFDPDGRANVRFGSVGNVKTKNIRIAYGHNDQCKLTIFETPVSHDQIIEIGDRAGANDILLGMTTSNIIVDTERISNNITIKKFKNLFIVFKSVNYTEIDNNNLMVRYEADNMVYALIDASNSTLPELLKDVSYPICVIINNSSAQLVLKEWGYTQLNDSGTVFIKNETSFRIRD
ncbi:odv-e25 [Cnaphalocrocis medinalis granulovirus]|uniref:Odv-e25 n=1 Tax=Cnaphalocrocis medinalis granulovirus TaxID=1750712 RepID=A0A0X9GJS6_9BBAC|nr:odv-e25 [Cnaphalocrocis medinalis granulovirus]ALN42013.1 odv-e25 [Cnaphalocrocis medinalis granulovirus]AMF83825.1 odv-e25 [Cnaphalocrocis medinalis granulovirus]WPN08703.1 odv-e25 [Cnaphalocrocis medinalis granulovirus]